MCNDCTRPADGTMPVENPNALTLSKIIGHLEYIKEGFGDITIHYIDSEVAGIGETENAEFHVTTMVKDDVGYAGISIRKDWRN